ncbi:uncharacterized protein LOC101989031 [Microtus ochrogaster]|uniref:Uncharacterized protein LOC101989031 n=1 Tax=Microtus ochrogaster TaxID=79684 RepID=A0ABM1UNU2_MICOH|nr:uncharacterized protein LOC101989031 [Microtus ochrogaster]
MVCFSSLDAPLLPADLKNRLFGVDEMALRSVATNGLGLPTRESVPLPTSGLRGPKSELEPRHCRRVPRRPLQGTHRVLSGPLGGWVGDPATLGPESYHSWVRATASWSAPGPPPGSPAPRARPLRAAAYPTPPTQRAILQFCGSSVLAEPEKPLGANRSLHQHHWGGIGDIAALHSQLLQILLTAEEKQRVFLEARKNVLGADGRPTQLPNEIEDAFPLTRPNWDFNTPAGRERLRLYRQILLAGLQGASRRPTNLAKVRAIIQGPEETPAGFLERLLEGYRMYTPFDPWQQISRLI